MTAIYTLSIECVWGHYLKERFYRVVEVPSDMTLAGLHYLMQELTGFADDHLSTFYMARNYRGKKTWFSEASPWGEDDEAMWEIPLADIFPLEKNTKLYYWFDFGDDWIFEIRKKRKEFLPVKSVEYPRVIDEEGPKPEQYPSFEE